MNYWVERGCAWFFIGVALVMLAGALPMWLLFLDAAILGLATHNGLEALDEYLEV